MKYIFLTFLFVILTSAASAMMKIGDIAPNFTINAALAGKAFSFSLSESLKKGPVVLYFYPRSFTSICTLEAHEFAEAMDQFESMNATVIGVSNDTMETQKKFSTMECHDKFPVGSDVDFILIKAYDAAFKLPGNSYINEHLYKPIEPHLFADRISYVITQEGVIVSAVRDNEAKAHIENALSVLKQLKKNKS